MHGRDGPYVMNKSKWPSLSLPEEGEEGLTQETIVLNIDSSQKVVARELAISAKSGEMQGDGATEEDIMDTLSNFSKDFEMEETDKEW